MQTSLKLKLSFFMFLQYFIWGAWYVTMGVYLAKSLHFEGQQIGWAYGAFAIGSIISPFFVGLIADRYFASEKLLAVLGIAGGLVLCLLPRVTTFSSFYPTLIFYCALFAPTLALGNSLALHHLRDARTDFPRIKILSAVGWIAGSATVSLLQGEQSAIQFYIAGGVSLLLGLFSLALPHTPPRKTGADVSLGEILGLDALALLKKRSFAIFIVCIFLICIPLYFYFVMMAIYLGELQWTLPALKMSTAQISDVVFLFLLPLMLRGLGYKSTILIGILAWALRYFLLAGSVSSSPALQTVLIFGAILAPRRLLRLPLHRRPALRRRRGERAYPQRHAGLHRLHPLGRRLPRRQHARRLGARPAHHRQRPRPDPPRLAGHLAHPRGRRHRGAHPLRHLLPRPAAQNADRHHRRPRRGKSRDPVNARPPQRPGRSSTSTSSGSQALKHPRGPGSRSGGSNCESLMPCSRGTSRGPRFSERTRSGSPGP